MLIRGIEDHARNYTRFLLLVPPRAAGTIEGRDVARRWKTSIVFRMTNKPGALFRALGAFALLEVDLARIESRPIEGRPWEYAFYLDAVGKRDDPTVTRALGNLEEMAEMVRVLGSYPTRW